MLGNKRVMSAGKGEPVELEDGAKMVFHYRVQRCTVTADGKWEEGGEVDDSRRDWPRGYGRPMEIICGKKFKLAAWESCLRTMRVDEVAQFVLYPPDTLEYPFVSKQLRDLAGQRATGCGGGGGCMAALARTGLGYPELDELLAKPEPLLFTFHLLGVLKAGEYERDSWSLSAEQKLASIPGLKEAGNQLFRRGKVEEAEKKYGECLSRLESLMLMEKPGEPEWVQLDKMTAPVYSNMAQVKLAQREYYAAAEAATRALHRDPDNGKALFRRAKARIGVWNLDGAREDLLKLRQLDPTCSNVVQQELHRITQLQQQTKSDEAARFRNIFH